MSIDAKQLLKQETERLNKVLYTPITVSQLRTSTFQGVIEKQLNILAFLENKNKTKKPTISLLVDRYNSLVNKKFAIDPNFKNDDLEELSDEMNYLVVYLKNILKIDLDSLPTVDPKKIEAQPTKPINNTESKPADAQTITANQKNDQTVNTNQQSVPPPASGFNPFGTNAGSNP